ncbi:MAG: hypothetical protein CBC24_00355 [Candidatus Pelagibacter sp. TMED64]|nr:MAG: hypothetical protein CBC24_00355 [Candidatus Pelagibacter sp. TMED64]
MISVDTVYQRVQAILNKENRGYMTPQEYNLLANQAQLEVFEQYFYDLNQFNRTGEITNEYANIVNNIKEKINLFRTTAALSIANSVFALPSDIYRLGTVYYNNTTELDAIDQNDFLHINASKLTKPDVKKPVYIRNGNNLTVYPSTITSLSCTYIKKPAQVVWGYVEISSVAKYDSSTATDFELHESDETTVVYKILSYAGLVIKQPEVSQVAEQKDNLKVQKEKS